MNEEIVLKEKEEKRPIPTPAVLTDLLSLNRPEYVYRFVRDGRVVTGITWPGTKALADYFGISVIEADIREVGDGFFGKAKAIWKGRTAVGGAYQPKKMKLRDGREVPDEKAAVKALNKAQRNAILNLLPIPKYVVRELTAKEAEGTESKVKDGVEGKAEEIEKGVQTWEVPSESDPATKYIVKRSGDVWSCSCPAFLFKGEECKHIKYVKKELGVEK